MLCDVSWNAADTLCLSLFLHSELWPLPDTPGHWEGELWKGTVLLLLRCLYGKYFLSFNNSTTPVTVAEPISDSFFDSEPAGSFDPTSPFNYRAAQCSGHICHHAQWWGWTQQGRQLGICCPLWNQISAVAFNHDSGADGVIGGYCP